MRVKITYTVELEEVEAEVAEIMSRATNDLDDAYQEIARIQTELDTKTGQLDDYTKSINFARIKMIKADQILQDCEAILLGYNNAKEQQEELENEVQVG